ncbi:WD40 repeat-like protein [Tilletiaria anomala UBC 951]|uniref:WD40 repeat-like protein n=1 Tax=Tilletiaria anomala (strain ATCC 24038 / CBS 436.72 / UBC 951) TaxID=1037660 RepID=A0A066VHU9_TILAU|nr:WD40 repeat-like protein [Tilletiaria anomala UBC 951]KDN39843.1 WD40 repeat-like protein [Tilletiaria anomala UBC 951]
MPRVQHFSCSVGIPVYAVDFIDDDVLVYAGGGGAGRSGVANAIRIARIDGPGQRLEQLAEIKLSRDEDAPMCMTVDRQGQRILCAINSVASDMKQRQNKSLRVFSFQLGESDKEGSFSSEIKPSASSASLNITDPEHYQKVLRLSQHGSTLLSAGTDGTLALQEYPSLRSLWPSDSREFAATEIYDGSFAESGAAVVLASAAKLKVLSTVPPGKEGNEHGPTVLQTIQNPALGGNGTCAFRAARFGRGDASRNKLFTVVNASGDAGGRGKRSASARKSFVTAWNAETWDLIETKHVSDKPVTSFDVSSDGTRLGFSSSDLSVGVLDSHNLRPLVRILSAHSFPATCIRFSPSGKYLVSGSADNTLRLVELNSVVTADGLSIPWTVLFTLFLLILAVYLQKVL